jgi:hypothetical protein
MQQEYANVVRSGDSNDPGVPQWWPTNVGGTVQLLRMEVAMATEPDRQRALYLFLGEASAVRWRVDR